MENEGKKGWFGWLTGEEKKWTSIV